jgi:hypothetical protein
MQDAPSWRRTASALGGAETDHGWIPRADRLARLQPDGPEAERALATGLASAEWYHSDVPRKEMKALMKRTRRARDPGHRHLDRPPDPLRGGRHPDLGHVVDGSFLGRLRRALRFGLRLALARMRTRHRLPTHWMNNAVYHIASFMVMRNPVSWRWSHARHHTDTIIVGRDPEIAFMRPPASAQGAGLHRHPDVFQHFAVLVRTRSASSARRNATTSPSSEAPR